PDVEYMTAQYLTTSGLIIVNCRMCFRKDTEDLFRIEGSNIMLNFGLSGSIAFEVDKLIPLHPAILTTHAISYTPNYNGRFLMPVGQQIHYICIILSESFYFSLISRESALHQNFINKVYKKEHTYFAPGPLNVTPRIRHVLAEIVTANEHGRLPRLLLETKIKELLVVRLEQMLYSEEQKETGAVLPRYDIS